MKLRGIIIIIIAVLLGLIAAYIAKEALNKPSNSIQNIPKNEFQGKEALTVDAIVAARDLKPGDTLAGKDMKKKSFLKSEMPQSAFTNINKLMGLEVKDFIYEDEVIRLERFAPKNIKTQKGEFTEEIEIGKRAISIHVSDVSGVSGLLQPGDIVDVVAVSNIDIPGFTGERVARIIAEGVKVLNTPSAFIEKQDKKDRQETVTLLVSPEEAVCISSADEGASLRLIARNRRDNNSTGHEVKGIFTRELGVANTEPFQADFISQYIAKILPEVNINIDSTPNAIILYGQVPDQETMDNVLKIAKSFCATEIKEIRNLMQLTGPQQVQLEVKIAEISRSGLKKAGFGFLARKGDVLCSGFNSGSIEGTMESATDTIGSGSILNPTYQNAFNAAVHIMSEDSNVMSIISFLKSKGLAKILAEPTLITISGQEASFLVGGSFPIPAKSQQDTIIEFKEYGVILSFVPTVIKKDTVNLMLATEVSEPDTSLSVQTGDTKTPATLTRKVKTVVQLKDGQSFAVAGLLKEVSSSEINKIPLLGDIPVLGALFRRNEWTTRETELVIFVTVRLVSPIPKYIEPSQLPGENMKIKEPSDIDFFVLGDPGKLESE